MIVRIKKIFVYHTLVFLLFASASIYITYPLIFNLGSLVTGYGDEFVIAWIQNWVIHTIFGGNIFSLFDANIYYPFIHSFAYSDLLITSSIFSIIPLFIVKEPIVVVNFTLITSLLLLGFSVYLLSFYITKNYILSFLSGLLVIFSPAVLDKVMHLQILAIYFLPLSILSFLHFIKTARAKFLIFALLLFVLQIYNSFLPGYFIALSLLIIFMYYFFSNKKEIKNLLTKKNVLLVLFFLVLIIPVIIPYYQVSKEYHYVRDIRETIHFALQPEDFLYASDKTRLQSFLNNLPFNKISQNEEFKAGYVGLTFTFLILITFFYALRQWAQKNTLQNSLVVISLLGLVLSLGPFLHLFRQTIHNPFPVPLPYLLFYYVAPGFQGFRNSARWEMLFIIIAAVIVALILHKLLSTISKQKRFIIYGVLLISVVVEYNSPMRFFPVPEKQDFPQVYSWLNTTPRDSRTIELPIYNWNMWPYTQNELLREYYNTTNFRKTVNGYSGFSPPPWQILVQETLLTFPSPESIAKLRSLGITYIIIHAGEYDTLHYSTFRLQNKKVASGEEILQGIKERSNLILEKQFDDTYVYKIK